MPTINRNRSLSIWLSNYSNLKPLQSLINICLILLGPILAVATYLFLGPFNVAGQSVWLRFFLLLDLSQPLVWPPKDSKQKLTERRSESRVSSPETHVCTFSGSTPTYPIDANAYQPFGAHPFSPDLGQTRKT